MDIDGSGDILTKAKLYATMSDDDSWTEMGVGIVSLVLRSSSSLDGDCGDSSSSSSIGGTNTEGAVGHLEMVDIDNPEELLMSTPITLSDAYVVQHETVLWWSDPQLGRLMACSFNTKEGCEKIYKEITAYQRSRKSAVSCEMNGAEVMNTHSMCSKWIVCRENLPAILSAATTNAQRFGVYVRGCDTYFKELAELFQACQRDGDVRGMDLTGQITLALLRSPFNTDGKIIAQFVENTLVDICVDIVQYAIGRRDRNTGFVSFEERRATFRNPLELPEFIVTRIHVLYSCGYLKDLLPLSLDEADAMPTSLLSTYLMSTKFRLIEEICRSPTFLPESFMRCRGNVGNSFEVMAFIHDMCKTIKNSMLPLDSKTSLFEALVEAGLLRFLSFVLGKAIDMYTVNEHSAELPSQNQLTIAPGMAMQMACDVVCNCIMMFPAGRGNLMNEVTLNGDRCLLELLLQCIVTGQRGTELQAAVDAIVSCGVGILQYMPGSIEIGGTTKQDVVRFWVEGVAGRQSPLLQLATHTAKLFLSCEKMQHSSHQEARVVHALKVLTALMGDIDEQLSYSFMNVLARADIMPAFATALRTSSRSAANVQSSVVAFVAAILCGGRWQVVEHLLGDGVFVDAAFRRYVACGQRSNVLSASLAHFFDVLCRVIHREKSTQARRSTDTVNSHLFCLLSAADHKIPACGDVAPAAAGETDVKGERQSKGNGVCQSVGSALWAAHEETLRARFPALASKLEHALHETLEEAQSVDAETSSVASTIERSMKNVTDSEFDAMVAEFGVELQPLRHLAPSLCSSVPFAPTSQGTTDESLEQAGIGGRDGKELGVETVEPLLKRHKHEQSSSSSSPSLFQSAV